MLARSEDGRRKPILAARYVLDLAAWAEGAGLAIDDGVTVREPEDLIPLAIAAEAAQLYAVRLLGVSVEDSRRLRAQEIRAALEPADGSVWTALSATFADVFDGGHIDKMGFAKEIVAFLERVAGSRRRPPGLRDLEANSQALITELAVRLRAASAEETDRRTNRRTDRLVKGFLRDHPKDALRDAAEQLLRDIDASLEDSPADEAVRREFACGGSSGTTAMPWSPCRTMETSETG